MVIDELTHRNVMRHYLLELLAKSGFEITTYQDGLDVIICQKMV
jgi:hypothetical protein